MMASIFKTGVAEAWPPMLHLSLKEKYGGSYGNTTQMRTKRGYFKFVTVNESTITCVWKRLKDRQGSGKALLWGKKKKRRLQVYWLWEAGGRLTRSRTSHVIDL